MGLSPKSNQQNNLKNWKDLDNVLQSAFKVQIKGEQPSATINPNEYEMSVQEIIDEGTKNGYNVKTHADGIHLVFH
ncbi:hypothetical protein ACLHK8_01355 [Pediococcus sp. M21F004]|uniref:hypothetical protein n=1 Tax=Pediococcus sp. M21F004 TaxID=3390033 RepID=UPI003DA721D3